MSGEIVRLVARSWRWPTVDDRLSGLVQAVASAVWCLWSFSRLWVAVISRHSERQAALPRRLKWSARRLCLVCAKTGSIIAWRCL